jgi:thymidylate kinase
MRRNEGAIFLFSRFFFDFYYQRGYRRAFIPALDLLAALGPRPDRIIVLKRDPAEIFHQKPELSEAEITEEYRLIHCRLSNWSGYVEIDASQGIEATVEKAIKLILP